MSLRSLALLGTSIISTVSAHGNVQGIVIGGKYYPGWDYSDSFESPLPDLIAWSTTVSDEGFVAPSDYTSSNIICHEGAKPGALTAKVAAGDTVTLQWTPWPDSHHGPVIDYLAPCNGDCAKVDKTSLEFFKLDQSGLINDATPPGTWASDKLIANNNSWVVTIPTDIASGSYVLRHEIIALHSAENQDGAQNYPQCINIQVTGGGSDKPSGESATKFYTPTEKGILIDIYQAISKYIIPGPPLYSAGGSSSGGSSSGGSASSAAPPASSAAPASSADPASSAPPAQSGGASYSAPAGSSAAPVSSAAPSGSASYSAPALSSGPGVSSRVPPASSVPAGSSAGAVSSSAAASSVYGSSSSKCTSTITISSSAAGGSSSYPGSSAGAVSSSAVAPAASSSGTGAYSLPIPSGTGSVPYPSASSVASGGFSIPPPSGTSVPYPSASISTAPSSASAPAPSASSPAGYPPSPPSSPDMEGLMAKIIRYIKASFRQAEHSKDFKKF